MRTEHRLTYLSAILGLALWLLTPAIGLAQPRVAVMNFENNSTWRYWGDNLGAAAADELVTQLLKTGSYRMIERSQLAAVLAEPFYTDRKGEIPEGKGPFYEMPVFHDHGGRITVYYVRDFIEAAQRMAEVPRLTALQIEAMDLLDELAEDPEFHLEIAFEPGDMQFLHNHQILHARTAYEDHADIALRRHLLRLWLSTPEGRELPPAYAERYGEIAVGGLRGGIMAPGVSLSAPLDVE